MELKLRVRARLATWVDAPSFWPTTFLIIVSVLCLNALGMLIKPAAFTRYFFDESTIYDIGNYHAIADTGYDTHNAAFYPLWPLVIKFLHHAFGPTHLVLAANLTATAIFFVAVGVLVHAMRAVMPARLAAFMVAGFAFNPNSLFHMLSYPESLTSLLTGFFLLSAHRYLKDGKAAALWATLPLFFLLSLSRPLMLQTFASVIGASLIGFWTRKSLPTRELRLGALMMIGATLGYMVYGIYCLDHLGSFFAPFEAQKLWGREPGLHWTLFYAPKTISSSDVVLLWDLQAFYGPVLVLWLLYKTPGASYLAWFCGLFAASHSAIAFLTLPIFMSLGRHVFAVPFFFYALGAGLVGRYEGRKTFRWLVFYTMFSAGYLVSWWERYSRAGWYG